MTKEKGLRQAALFPRELAVPEELRDDGVHPVGVVHQMLIHVPVDHVRLDEQYKEGQVRTDPYDHARKDQNKEHQGEILGAVVHQKVPEGEDVQHQDADAQEDEEYGP